VSSAHVERDVPAYSPNRTTANVTAEPWPGYWLELDLAERFDGARDRWAANKTNAHFDALNAEPFGSVPTSAADEGPDLLAAGDPEARAS
jgi:hypothetical protein